MKVIALWDNYCEGGDAGHDVAADDIFAVPTVWMSDSCLLRERKPFYIPEFDDDFRIFPTLAVKIMRLGKNIPVRVADRYRDELSVWFNVRACGLLRQFGSDGAPLASAVAFDNSLVSAPFFKIGGQDLSGLEIVAERNGEPAVSWRLESLKLGIDEAIHVLSRTNTLKTGDVILAGFTRDGIRISRGDEIRALLRRNAESEQEVFTEFKIK